MVGHILLIPSAFGLLLQTAAAQSILGSAYYHGLTQYGIDGKAHIANTFIDGSDPVANFSDGDLVDVVVSAQDKGAVQRTAGEVKADRGEHLAVGAEGEAAHRPAVADLLRDDLSTGQVPQCDRIILQRGKHLAIGRHDPFLSSRCLDPIRSFWNPWRYFCSWLLEFLFIPE